MSGDPYLRSTRDALLVAAAELVARHGTNVSLAQIGELAGASRGAVTHVFGGKEELLAALADVVGEQWSTYNLGATTGTFGEWLDAWVEPLLSAPERQRLPIVLLQEATGPRVTLASPIRMHRRALHTRLTFALDEFGQAGITIPTGSARAGLILSGVFGLFALHYSDPSVNLERGYGELRAVLNAVMVAAYD